MSFGGCFECHVCFYPLMGMFSDEGAICPLCGYDHDAVSDVSLERLRTEWRIDMERPIAQRTGITQEVYDKLPAQVRLRLFELEDVLFKLCRYWQGGGR